ncbi:MAG TPA: hypothetical protein VFT47_17625 [Vicinamibacterales bacterium]|nr:hypothetical protein [Vicinamibacterales bacterium]
MVAYIGSRSPLPLIPFQESAPAFNVTEITEQEQAVLVHLALPHVRQVGSHTSCGCGFNEGREHPEVYDDPAAERAGALESSARLAQYVREHRVEQIYSCWSGDEAEAQEFERHVTPADLVAENFFLRERELLVIDHSPRP